MKKSGIKYTSTFFVLWFLASPPELEILQFMYSITILSCLNFHARKQIYHPRWSDMDIKSKSLCPFFFFHIKHSRITLLFVLVTQWLDRAHWVSHRQLTNNCSCPWIESIYCLYLSIESVWVYSCLTVLEDYWFLLFVCL